MGNSNFPKEGEDRMSYPGVTPQPKFSIILNTLTWKKESYGLFDYESKNFFSREQIKLNSASYIVRDKEDIKAFRDRNFEGQNIQLLAEITNRNGDFYLEAQNYDLVPNDPKVNPMKKVEESNDNCLWNIIRNMKDNTPIKHHLNKRDCIKMGRVKIRVRDFRSMLYKEKQNENFAKENINYKPNNDSSNSICCRICLVEEAGIDNPFVSPCICDGTMKYVHIKCIQKWLKNKLKTTIRPLYSIIEWKPLECELCQTHFSDYIMGPDGIMYEMVEIPKPDGNYIVLEFLNKESNSIDIIQIVNMSTKNIIKIGRGVDTDLRINDISVSRVHAFIKLENGSFYLEDNHSKFGTLVLLNRPLILNKNNANVDIQCGRTVLKFNVKKKQTSNFGCFGKAEKRSPSPGKKQNFTIESKQKNDIFQTVAQMSERENNNIQDNMQPLNNNIQIHLDPPILNQPPIQNIEIQQEEINVVMNSDPPIHNNLAVGIINFNDSEEDENR